MSVENLIASLDVKEKARVKNTIGKGNEGHSSIDLVQRNPHGKNKGENKPFNAKLTTTFEKKKNKTKLPCFTCGKLGHFSNECPDRADLKGKKKNVNLVTISNAYEEYGNVPTVLSGLI